MTELLAYDYLKLILEEEFFAAYLRFINHGILHYELTNILEICSPLLTGLDEDDRFLRYEIIGITANYLQDDQQQWLNVQKSIFANYNKFYRCLGQPLVLE